MTNHQQEHERHRTLPWIHKLLRLQSIRKERLGVALIGLLLLAIFLWRDRGNTEVPLGPQQTVQTINPKMGVHTRLTDEVEPWKVKRTLEMVREMGAPWIVEYFPWAYAEPRQGHFTWGHHDLVINHATRQGLTIIARLGFVPEWARPKATTPLYLDEEHFADFGAYAAQFVERYRGQIHYIIVWNEPNLSLEWGYQKVSPAKYVAMLRTVYPMIKAVDPTVQVLAGALAPTLAPPGSQDGMNDLAFLQAMYDAGAAPYFDMLAIHAYGWYSEPEEPPAPEVVNLRRTELLRAIMVENGDGAKHAIITEGGWNDHPRWTRAVRPGQRIDYTIRAYALAQREWPWLDALCFWVFRYPWDAKNYQDYYTFVRTDFEPKPIYLDVQSYARGHQP
ncbi:MAG: beta-galactosidase [Caldilineaceae bacterium]